MTCQEELHVYKALVGEASQHVTAIMKQVLQITHFVYSALCICIVHTTKSVINISQLSHYRTLQ